MSQLSERQLLAIAKSVKEGSDKDPERNVDTAILDKLTAVNPSMGEQEADHYSGRILEILTSARETGRWEQRRAHASSVPKSR